MALTDQTAGAGTLQWYLRRLKKMSPAELAWRGADQARKFAWSALQEGGTGTGTGAGASPAATLAARVLGDAEARCRPLAGRAFKARLPQGALGALSPGEVGRLVAAADEVMAGRWHVLGVDRADMEAPDWFVDPLSGRRAPRHEYCFRVEHRNEEVTGNVKQVWEPSRMHHVTVLAAAYAVSGDARYAERAARHLRSWWEANPPLSGVHWTSGIELGIRLISWAWTRRLLEGWGPVTELFEHNETALRQIWWHQRYLATFRSRGSSANNHVVAEAAGQLVAALAFDWFPESARWADGAARLLESQLERNTFPSGVNREMAFDYHGLVAELGLVAGAEAELAGRPLSPATWDLLCRMTDVVAATVDERLAAPRYGDGDDGRGLVLHPGDNRWEVLLACGAGIFGALDWWPRAEEGAMASWLAAMAGRHHMAGRPARRPASFADAGLSVLRTGPGSGPEIWCRCDGGPQGFLSIAAHGHADALSVEVRHGGVEVLADPGTYCYHGEPRWRAYFRSTRAHNTVELAAQDQASSGGPFMWARTAKTSVRRAPGAGLPPGSEQVWSAEHDGYEVLSPSARHRRTVTLRPAERELELLDEVVVEGSVDFALHLHFGPAVTVGLGDGRAELSWQGPGGRSWGATVELPAGCHWQLARGETEPVLGWYSRGFGHKEPASTLVGRGTANGGRGLATVLRFHDRPGTSGGDGASSGHGPAGGDGPSPCPLEAR